MNIQKITPNRIVKYQSDVSFKSDKKTSSPLNAKSSNAKMLALTLGGLGVAGTAAFLILKKKKMPTKTQITNAAEEIISKPKNSKISYPAEFVSSEISLENDAYDYLKRNVEGFYLTYGIEMNTFLRTGKLKEPPQITDDIPEGIKEYIKQQAVKIKDTNRAIVDSIEMLDKRFTSKTTEPMTVYRDAPRSWLDTAENGILTDKAFCSTSLTPGASLEGLLGADAINNIRYEIRLPKGTSYLDLTNTSEQEMLLPRNSKFRIIGDKVIELIL